MTMTEILILLVSVATAIAVAGVIFFTKTKYDAALQANKSGFAHGVTNSRKHR
jgi:hypothetical protein